MNLQNLNVQELSVQEQQEIDGGKNIFEYIAYGIGYIAGVFSSAEGGSSAVAREGLQKFVHNSGGLKY